MLCILPLMFGRTLAAWCLLMLASLASGLAPWWAIDAAGAIVFASWPGWPPRLIAGVFLAMLAADLTHPHAWQVSMALGWVQFGALLLWAMPRPQLNPLRGVLT